jgi:putative membrane protein
MKIFSLMILLSLTALSLAGCSGHNSSTGGTNNNATMNTGSNANSSQVTATNSNAGAETRSNMSLSNSPGRLTTPETFMSEAAAGGIAEIELSTLAKSKAQDAEVKKFAQQMIQDHSNANTELKQLAGKKNITLPTELDPMHKGRKEKLASLSGADFDSEYVQTMVADHEKSVALFQSQANGGTDAEAKAFAAKTLPKLQMHLEMIKGIQSKMKSGK